MGERRIIRWVMAAALLVALAGCGEGQPPLMAVPGLKPDPDRAAWSRLPRLTVQQAVVYRGQAGTSGYNIHSYLVEDGGRLRVMWTSNPVNEGEAGSRVMQAFSDDGRVWTPPQVLTPAPPPGQRYFARGYWQRDGRLLALVSQDRTGPFFGPNLKMLVFGQAAAPEAAVPEGGAGTPWSLLGVAAVDTITNYAPRRLADGQWLESSRDSATRVGFIKGGVKGLDDWRRIAVPLPSRRLEWRLWPETTADRRPAGEGWKSWIRIPRPMLIQPRLDEPVWWPLPDGRLAALYRDNSGGGRLYRSFGDAGGEIWTRPVQTNFPDAASKLAGTRLANGLYVLVSNPRPDPRDRSPLVLSVSRDGLSFRAMAILADAPTRRRIFGQRKTPGYQYPQLLEQGGDLLVTYSRNKEDIEVLRVSTADIAALLGPDETKTSR